MRALSLGLLCIGLVGTVISGGILVDVWYARWDWSRSEEAKPIARATEMPPPRTSAATSQAPRPGIGDSQGRTAEPTVRPDATPRSALPSLRRTVLVPTFAGASSTEPSASAANTLDVTAAEFRFLDLPAPGAHARIAVTVTNRASQPSKPLVVSISTAWFDLNDVIGAIPEVLDDRSDADGYRAFVFPGAAPGADTTMEIHVLSRDEAASAPTVRLALDDGESLGDVQLQAIAPPPPPGPVRALSVPRLGIQTNVVQTGWEPPSFVAGQITGSAALGEGNSVLIGHRNGRAGDVFGPLTGARVGDEMMATSSGLAQRYVVTAVRTLPEDDTTPMKPTATPRLTLMTCTGVWNPLTGDYSHRLWVIAEPRPPARGMLTVPERP
jgi:LPXTG-site transpeptidase (sortase) family protein